MELPKHYTSKESEQKWSDFWSNELIYKYTPSEKPTYAVDTPPPTVSGKMHVGHAFSFTQQDIIVRYKRMRGFNVFHPFGTDDNGLPTEKLVEKTKNIRATKMSREEFIKICQEVIANLTPGFIVDWKRIGMSCDFSTPYSTISDYAIKTAQKSFIELYKKDQVYQKTSPTVWDTRFQSAVAQAELEDQEKSSSFLTIAFSLKDSNDEFLIGTTRPELIPACVAIFIHPEDKKNNHLIGRTAIIPLTNHEVQILEDKSVNPEKGTGILMICSYGDRFDVDAIARRQLTPRPIITKEGKLSSQAGPLANLTVEEARKKAVELLNESSLLKDQKQITHTVNVYEKSGIPIEFVATTQWFVKVLDKKEMLLDAGKQIKWYPESMSKRYDNWVKNLNWDWCISRQRPFGVPFPIWYDEKGNVVLPEESELPVFPATQKPKGKEQENLIPELDVMDTWATSSLTPQLSGNWLGGGPYEVDFKDVSPFSLRPQAHDIIRTWAFYTILKSKLHQDKIPWTTIAISGNVADPKGEKMSKSKGNVVDPTEVMDKYSADALRCWASGSKLGDDLKYNEKDLVAGQKTVTKLWNATRFSLLQLENFTPSQDVEYRLIDRWLLTKLHKLSQSTTKLFDEMHYARVKLDIDAFFWQSFTGNYMELVKDRLYNQEVYGKEAEGSKQALYQSLYAVTRFFAPFMPFITEEIYQLYFKQFEKQKSIHLTNWPSSEEFLLDEQSEVVGDVLIGVADAVRKEKAEKKVSMKEPVKQLFISAEIEESELEQIRKEIQAGLNVQEIVFTKGVFGVDVRI